MSHISGSGGTLNGDTDVSINTLTSGDVLIWNGSAWANSLISAGSSLISISTPSLTSSQSPAYTYQAVLTDNGTEIEMNSTQPNTLVIPLQATVAWPAGSNFNVRQMGVGLTTIAAQTSGGNTVTLYSPNGLNIANQYMTATIIRSSLDTWVVDGGVST